MIRTATADDVAFVVANMRPEDAKEIWTLTGKPAAEAVADLNNVPYLALVLWRDEPVAIFGATLCADRETAVMFRFATSKWPTVVREAIRFGKRQFLDRMREIGIKRLFACTAADSDTTWLQLFGAEKCGGFVNAKGHHFERFIVDLMAPAS